MTPAALPTLRTPRLTLRPLEMTDADAIVDGVGKFDVSKWLGAVPYPYTVENAREYIEAVHEEAQPVWGIEDETGLVGSISTHERLGYWLARPSWRKGYGLEASVAVVAHWFLDPKTDLLASGFFDGNTKSENLLRALGFRIADKTDTFARSLNQRVPSTDVVLTRKAWEARQNFTLYAPRLTLRPLAQSDAESMVALSVPEVAQNTSSFVPGWSMAEAQCYIKARQWCGTPGFMLAVEHQGTFTGVVGCGGSPLSAMYAFHPDHWGQGLATEAMSAFLPEIFDRFPVNRLVADHFEDNPASGRVLQKLGFKETGRDTAISKARLEPAPVITYAVTRDTLRTPA